MNRIWGKTEASSELLVSAIKGSSLLMADKINIIDNFTAQYDDASLSEQTTKEIISHYSNLTKLEKVQIPEEIKSKIVLASSDAIPITLRTIKLINDDTSGEINNDDKKAILDLIQGSLKDHLAQDLLLNCQLIDWYITGLKEIQQAELDHELEARKSFELQPLTTHQSSSKLEVEIYPVLSYPDAMTLKEAEQDSARETITIINNPEIAKLAVTTATPVKKELTAADITKKEREKIKSEQVNIKEEQINMGKNPTKFENLADELANAMAIRRKKVGEREVVVEQKKTCPRNYHPK